jgi:hypothetical protein
VTGATGGAVHVADPVAAAVSRFAERVFGTVDRVHAAAVRAASTGELAAGRPVLGDVVRELLDEPGQLAVGLGLVVAPRPGDVRPPRLEWWQADPHGEHLRRLDPDLRPTSLGYYDYTVAPWFDVPRRTGRRHVVGPHVDVHGTGRYLLTLTQPVVVGGTFVGVAGADVPVRRFEFHLLEMLGGPPRDVVIVNDEARVVLSTAPRIVVGALLDAREVPSGAGQPVPGVPWRIHRPVGGGPLLG